MYNFADYAVRWVFISSRWWINRLSKMLRFPCMSYTIVRHYKWRKKGIADVRKSSSEKHAIDIIHALYVANLTLFHRLIYRRITVHFSIGMSHCNGDIVVALHHYIFFFSFRISFKWKWITFSNFISRSPLEREVYDFNYIEIKYFVLFSDII